MRNICSQPVFIFCGVTELNEEYLFLACVYLLWGNSGKARTLLANGEEGGEGQVSFQYAFRELKIYYFNWGESNFEPENILSCPVFSDNFNLRLRENLTCTKNIYYFGIFWDFFYGGENWSFWNLLGWELTRDVTMNK